MDEELLQLAYNKMETDASFEQFKTDLQGDEGLQKLVYGKFDTEASFEDFKSDLFGQATQPSVEPKKDVAEVNGESDSPSASTSKSLSDSPSNGKLPDFSTFMSDALGDVDSPIARQKIEDSAASVVDRDPKKKKEIQELRETGNIEVADNLRQKYISEEVNKSTQFDKFNELKEIIADNTTGVKVGGKSYLEAVYDDLSVRDNNKYETVDSDVTEVKEIFGDLDKYGLNSNDINGFIDSGNSNIKDINRAGYFTTDTTDILLNSKEEKTLRETAKHNSLSIYLNDRLSNLNGKYLGLTKKGNMEDAAEVRGEIIKTVKGYQDYVKKELPNYYRDQQQKLVDEYEEYKSSKTIGSIKKVGNAIDQSIKNFNSGINNASGDSAAYLLDLIGADEASEYQRMVNSYNKEFDNSSLDFGVVEGFKVNHKGTNYRVTDTNRIIDLDLGKDVTAIADRIGLDREAILKKAEASNNFDTSYSTSGLIKKGANVLGNLAFQIAATRGVNGTLGLTSKGKALISTMTVQSGMIASSTYEETLNQLRNANIDDDKAKGEALDLSLKLGAVAAVTSIISPNSGAIGITSKSVDKSLVKKLAASYVSGGKDAFRQTLMKSLKEKGAVMAREGIEESIQEMTELIAQKNFNATVNQNLGSDVLDTSISKAEVMETFILSGATGSLAAGLGKTKSDFNDRLSIINQLSKDIGATTKYIDQMQDADAISKEAADKIKRDVVNFAKFSDKIPQDIENSKVEPLLNKLEERNELELRKKNEDPAFHDRIKAKIKGVDSDIDFILRGDQPLVIPSKQELTKTLKKGTWGIVTAQNPEANEVGQDENVEFNKVAKQWLTDRGYETQEVEGNYKGTSESSFFVPDLKVDDAIEFAREFNQESVATSKGIVYQDGSFNPRVEGDQIGGDFEGNFSTIKLPEGKVNFQVNYDLNNRVSENVQPEVEVETTIEGEPVVAPNKAISESTKKVADSVRKLKVHSSVRESMSKLQSSPAGVFTFAWDGAIETVATTIEATGNLAQAIDNGFVSLKKSDWYKSLSDNGKKMAERKFKDEFKNELNELEKQKPKQGKLDKITQTVGQKVVDVYTNLNRAVEALDGAKEFWKKQGLFESKAANQVTEMLEKFQEGIKAIAKSNFTVDDISKVMYAKHALDRNKYIVENVDGENPFGSGMTDQKANAILDSLTSEQRAEVDKLSEVFYELINDSRSIMVKTGLMSQKAVDQLKMSNDTYVPLTGFADEQIEVGSNIVQGKKVNVKGKEFKGVTGRTTEANNIIANIIKQYTDIAIRGSKNELLQSFDDINKINPKEDIPFRIYTQETLPKSKKGTKADGTINYTKAPAAIEDGFVGFKKNGKQFYIQFDNPVLAENLNRATDSVVDGFTRTVGKLNRFLSAAFTQYNPTFMIPNFFRDLQTGLINLKAQADINKDLDGKDLSGKVAKTVLKSIRTIHQIERGAKASDSEGAKYYEEFKAEGAKTGWANRMTLSELTDHVNSVEKMMSAGVVSTATVKKGFQAFSGVVDNANTAIENGVRLSTFIEARKAGLSKLDAASLAKELTINFNRRGEVGGLMNTLYLFFNASVQGTVNFKNNMLKFKEYEDANGNKRKTLNRGQKAALAVIISSTALAMYNMGMSGEDEESGLDIYDSIPDYEKERNMIIMKPDGKSYFKIPLPYGYNIFSNMGTMMAETIQGQRKASDASAFMLGSVFGSFAPLSSPKRDNSITEVSYMMTPTLAKPVAMLYENKDFFGSQIYRENFPTAKDKLATSQLGGKRTATPYKVGAIWLNSVGGGNAYEESILNFHPDKAQFLVNFFGGGALKFLKDTYGVGETLLLQQEGADIPLEVRDVPLVSKVYGEDTGFPEMQIYYNVKEKYRRRLNHLKSKEGKEDHLENPSERGNLQRLDAYYKSTDKELKTLRKQEKKILLMKDGVKRVEESEKLDVQKRKVYARHIKKYLRVKNRLVGDYE